MGKNNTYAFAEQELDILVRSAPDPENRPLVEEFIPEILALAEKFGNSGQSGGSAPFVAAALSSVIKKLCLYEPICPITGIDEEWVDITGINGGESMYQNKRDSRVFKDGKNGQAYFIDAIVFKGQNGNCFTSGSVDLQGEADSNNGKIGSTQYVKSFPFEPKTFYIDVIETEWADKEETKKQVGGGWWTSIIEDENQLKEVFEYYDRFKR